jgi:hypothetical protein
LVTGQANNLLETKKKTDPMAGTIILVLDITPPTLKTAASSQKTVPPFLPTISFLVLPLSCKEPLAPCTSPTCYQIFYEGKIKRSQGDV